MDFADRVKKHSFWFVASAMSLAAVTTWQILNFTVIMPCERENDKLMKQVEVLTQQTSYQAFKTKAAEYEKEKLALQNDLNNTNVLLEQWKESHEQWRLQNEQYKNLLSAAYQNANTYQKITVLENQRQQLYKEIDDISTPGQYTSRFSNPPDSISEASLLKINERRYSLKQIQEQIMDLQKKIRCQP